MALIYILVGLLLLAGALAWLLVSPWPLLIAGGGLIAIGMFGIPVDRR